MLGSPLEEPFMVAAIISGRQEEILLHLRDDAPGIAWPGYWPLPSGLAEPGETPADAMARELDEETGPKMPLTQRLEFPKDSEGDLWWSSPAPGTETRQRCT